MKQVIIAAICALVCAVGTFAKEPDYEPQLKQLAGELAAFTVGTSDATFESCEYTDQMITFVINPKSKIGQYRLANPFEEKFCETMISKMFSGNPQQGMQIMDFLVGTRTPFCFKLKAPGTDDYNEETVWPGDVKPLLEAMLKK